MGGLKHDVMNMQNETLVERLRKRAEIRRMIPRGEPDRIADLLEEAAREIGELEEELTQAKASSWWGGWV